MAYGLEFYNASGTPSLIISPRYIQLMFIFTFTVTYLSSGNNNNFLTFTVPEFSAAEARWKMDALFGDLHASDNSGNAIPLFSVESISGSNIQIRYNTFTTLNSFGDGIFRAYPGQISTIFIRFWKY